MIAASQEALVRSGQPKVPARRCANLPAGRPMCGRWSPSLYSPHHRKFDRLSYRSHSSQAPNVGANRRIEGTRDRLVFVPGRGTRSRTGEWRLGLPWDPHPHRRALREPGGWGTGFGVCGLVSRCDARTGSRRAGARCAQFARFNLSAHPLRSGNTCAVATPSDWASGGYCVRTRPWRSRVRPGRATWRSRSPDSWAPIT